MERQPTEWENIFANEATDKGLISKIYKHLIQLNIKTNKQKKNNQKISRRSKPTFVQRRHTDGQKTHEKMLNITRQMPIKTTKRYHLIPLAIIKKSTNNK